MPDARPEPDQELAGVRGPAHRCVRAEAVHPRAVGSRSADRERHIRPGEHGDQVLRGRGRGVRGAAQARGAGVRVAPQHARVPDEVLPLHHDEAGAQQDGGVEPRDCVRAVAVPAD